MKKLDMYDISSSLVDIDMYDISSLVDIDMYDNISYMSISTREEDISYMSSFFI
jgi:hypothetical protein